MVECVKRLGDLAEQREIVTLCCDSCGAKLGDYVVGPFVLGERSPDLPPIRRHLPPIRLSCVDRAQFRLLIPYSDLTPEERDGIQTNLVPRLGRGETLKGPLTHARVFWEDFDLSLDPRLWRYRWRCRCKNAICRRVDRLARLPLTTQSGYEYPVVSI